MRTLSSGLAVAGLLAGLALPAATGTPPAASLPPGLDVQRLDLPRLDLPRLDPGQIRWRSVELEASKLIFTAETTIALSAAGLRETREALPEGLGDLPIGKDGAVVVDVDTLAVGKRSRDRVWLRPADAAALARLKERLGGSPYEKAFRFAPAVVSLRRLAPRNDDESRSGRLAWSKLEEKRFLLPEGVGACAAASAPAALFYLIAARPLATGETATLCVFSDPAFLGVEVTAVRWEETEVDFVLAGEHGELRQTGRRRVQRLALRPRSLDGAGPDGSSRRDFEILGLQGDVEIVLDPEHRLPLRVEGQLESWGSVVVRLTRATLVR